MGEGALSSNNGSAASNNTAVGWSSLNANTTGDQNTAIGSTSNVGSNNLYNATAIGFGAIVNASNTIQLGNTSVSSVVTSGTISATGGAILGTLRVTGGSPSAGKVLVSDASGNATWQTSSGITGVGTVTSVNPITVNASGSTFTSTVTNASTTPSIALTIPLASVTGTSAGLLSKSDYDIFNAKQSSISLRFRSGGNYNIGIGASNGYETLGQASTPTGANNIAIGNNAMGTYYINDLTGSHNIALGTDAGGRNTTGSDNIFLGSSAGMNNYNGSQNTFIGRLADVSSDRGYGNGYTNATAIGYDAKVSGSNKIQLGNGSVTSVNTSGALTTGTVTYPIAHGSNGQVLSTTGSGTLTWITPSAGITGVGTMTTTSYAAGATVSGNSLILAPADGTNGGIVTNGTQTFAGAKTFDSDISVRGIKIGFGGGNITSNIALGSLLNANTSGNQNIAIGSGALNANTTGAANTAIGFNSLNFSTINNYNTAIGYQSLGGNTEGSDNTGVGKAALGTNTTGSRNTAIGFEANVVYNNLTNATAIGAYAKVSTSNTIQLGADGTAGTTAITNVKTSGTLTAGTVTYPNTHGTNGQVLSTTGSGTLTWTTASAGISGVGTLTTTSYANGATVSGNNLILAPADITNGGILTNGTQTIQGQKSFDKAVTNRVAYNAGSTTSIDFSNSNLAYTTASPGAFTLTGMKDGGTYTLAVQGTTSGTASFTISGYTNVFLGNYASVSGKETVYTFVVMGVSGSGKVYISMVSQQ